MNVSRVDLVLWVAGLVSQSLCLFVLLVRGRSREFPIFTVFAAEGAIQTAGAMLVKAHFSFAAYQHYFWAAGILDECLQLFVLYEIATHVFAPTGEWAADVRRTLVAMAAISSVVAVLFSLLASPATKYPMQTFIMRSNFFSAMLMSELFVGMVVLSGTVGLPWKTHAARIAQGLGGYSLICIALGIARIFYGLFAGGRQFDYLNHIRGIAYLACEAYWIVMLWAEAPAPRELPEAMRIQIYTLQRQVENDLVRIRSWRKN